MLNPTDLAYYARRAEREAVLALLADDDAAAAAHAQMSRLYSDRVVRSLGADLHAPLGRA